MRRDEDFQLPRGFWGDKDPKKSCIAVEAVGGEPCGKGPLLYKNKSGLCSEHFLPLPMRLKILGGKTLNAIMRHLQAGNLDAAAAAAAMMPFELLEHLRIDPMAANDDVET